MTTPKPTITKKAMTPRTSTSRGSRSEASGRQLLTRSRRRRTPLGYGLPKARTSCLAASRTRSRVDVTYPADMDSEHANEHEPQRPRRTRLQKVIIAAATVVVVAVLARSEERRVGKEGGCGGGRQ